MHLRIGWVFAVVAFLTASLVMITSVGAAPTVSIPLGSDAIALTVTVDDLAADAETLMDDGALAIVRSDTILGNERDVITDKRGVTYQWDGTDSSGSLEANGLGGVDLTNGGVVTRLSISTTEGRGDLTLTVYDDLGGKATVGLPRGTTTVGFDRLQGVDLTRVGAIELTLPGGAALQRITTESDLSATRTTTLVQDANGNAQADDGDLIAYTLTFINKSNTTSPAATWRTTVQGTQGDMVGTPIADRATVSAERQGAATTLTAQLPALAAGEKATLTYQTRAQGGLVSVELVTFQGQVVPSGTIGTLNTPFTNGDGEEGFVAVINTTDRGIWFDDGIIWLASTAAPTNTLVGGELTMGIGDDGEFIYSPSVDGDDAVWTQAGLLYKDGDAAPGFPAPAVTTFHSRPQMLPNGTGIWVAGTNLTGGTASTGRAVYSDADGEPGGTVLRLATTDTYDGFPIDDPSGISFDYQYSDNDAHSIQQLVLDTTNTTNDDVLGVDGTIRARESEPTGQGDNWSGFGAVTVNDSGTYLFSGDTGAATATDNFLAYSDTIAVREGTSLDGILLATSATVNAVGVNNLDQAAFIWTYTGGETLFAACDATNPAGAQAILSVGDSVDINGDTKPDGTITDFNASNGIGPGVWLAEDGKVYVEVDINFVAFGGPVEAVIGMDTNCGAGPTPTPTATANTTQTATATPTTAPTNTATPTATPGVPPNAICISPAVAIPDNNPTGINSSLVVTQTGTIVDMNVYLDITHTWVGDLDINLAHNAATALLIGRPGVPATTNGCQGDNIANYADDEASSAFETACSNTNPAYPPGNSFIPGDPAGPNLAAFDGQELSGTWTLNVTDNAGTDTGTLNQWCLVPTTGTGPTVTASPSATVIVEATFTPTTPPTLTPSVTATGQGERIEVTPAALTETHTQVGEVTTQTLTIRNVGSGALQWAILEDNDPAPNPIVPRDPNAVPHRLTNAIGLGQGNPTTSLGEILGDGSFETGSPNASWEEFSLNFGTPLCTVEACGTGTGTGPRTGDWWAWFGGVNAQETGALTQTITLPYQQLELHFWLEIPVADNDAFLSVRMDGEEIFRADETTPGYSTYAEVVVDITDYADGTHELSFYSEQSAGTNVTNIFVDDVSIVELGDGICSSPNDVPWLSANPLNGVTSPGSGSPVTVTFDSTGLEPDVYTAELCVASTDPTNGLVAVPITLTVESPPTAIDLTSLTQSSGDGVGFTEFAAAGLLLVAGAVLVLRRK